MKPIAVANTFSNSPPPWNLVNLDADLTNATNAINDMMTYSAVFSDTGVVNAMVVNLTAGLTVTLTVGLTVDVLIANTNTLQAVTLNVGGLGAVTVKNQDLSSPQVGQLFAGSIVRFVYDGTYFQVQGACSGGAIFNSLGVFSTGGTQIFLANAGVGIVGYGPNAATTVDMRPDFSTFTASATGFTTTPTPLCVWSKMGLHITMNIAAFTATSNATTFTLTGIYSGIMPPTLNQVVPINSMTDNGIATVGCAAISAGTTTITLYKGAYGGAWTSSGTKGFGGAPTMTWILN